MDTGPLVAFAIAAIVLAASMRAPALAVSALLAVFISAPYEIYHNSWSFRGAFGAFDIADLATAWMLYVAAFRTMGRAYPEGAGSRVGAAVLVNIAAFAYTALSLLANDTNFVLNDARTFLAGAGAAWYLLTYPLGHRAYRRIVWFALVLGFATNIWNYEGFSSAASEGARADADLWIRPLLPAVMLLGWPVAETFGVAGRPRREALAVLVLGGAALTVTLITQTRGYLIGVVASVVTAIVLSGALRRVGLAIASAALIGALAIGLTGPGSAAGDPVRASIDAAAGRLEWDESADSRRIELVVLADQMEGFEWVVGRGFGGTYDASLAHPGWALARTHPYTHAGHGTFVLKFGLLGASALFVLVLGALLRSARFALAARGTPEGATAAGIAGGIVGFLATNSADPICVTPLAMVELGLALAAAAALVPAPAQRRLVATTRPPLLQGAG